MVVLVLWMLIVFFLRRAHSSCFKEILLKTQDCSNSNIVYYSMEGEGSGFGSEFFYFFVHALKDAILQNARLKYVITGKEWENDCPGEYATVSVGLVMRIEHLGWACYFDFPCHDSVIQHTIQQFMYAY